MVDIVNIVNVSTQAQPRGLGFYNVNNVIMFTAESPAEEFGSDVYRSYATARDVETDWGTGSRAYALAQKVFAQSPNLLSGGGNLLIAPMKSDETLSAAITRLYAKVYFGGIITAKVVGQEEAVAAILHKLLILSLFWQVQSLLIWTKADCSKPLLTSQTLIQNACFTL